MVFYPSNIDRRDRALQLQSDIVFLQNAATQAKAYLDKEDVRMVPYINQILKNNGLSSFDELRAKLNATLTPEQRKLYDDLVENSARIGRDNDIAIITIGAITLTSGVTFGAIDIANFLRAGNLLYVLRGYARAFITLVTEGFEAGARAFRLMSNAVRWADETLFEASQVAKYAANASRYLKFITIAGILADGFILAYSLYEEKKQKEELQKAIKELYVNRIVAKVFSQMCDAIKTQDGLMLGYLILVGDDGKIPPQDQQHADQIAAQLVTNVKGAWNVITTSSSLDLLILLDKQRGSWTNDDPSYNDAIAGADDQLNQDSLEAASKASALNTAKAVKAAAHGIATAHEEFYPTPTQHLTAALIHMEDLKKAQIVDNLKAVIAPTVLIR